jgi:hypothetical protein
VLGQVLGCLELTIIDPVVVQLELEVLGHDLDLGGAGVALGCVESETHLLKHNYL